MKFKIVLSVIGILFLLACQSSIVSSGGNLNVKPTSMPKADTPDVASEEENLWVPTAIQECIAKLDVGEPFKFETFFNPYYLRADLDGNDVADFAILIKGKSSQKRGVVICKDSKQPFVFGELSKPKSPLTSFENDNFVTGRWEISTKEETRTKANQLGRKIAPNAKGESIVFVFEGGNGVNVYWDGTTFQFGE